MASQASVRTAPVPYIDNAFPSSYSDANNFVPQDYYYLDAHGTVPYESVYTTPNKSHHMPRESPTRSSTALIETSDLPSPYDRIFSKYTYFNEVQSAAFGDIFQSVSRINHNIRLIDIFKDDNVVVSSPTGSGKTALFELAICRLAHLNPASGCKIIYMVRRQHPLT